MSSVTIVAAWYPYPRVPFAQHIACVHRLLALNVPIVLYTSSTLEEYVRDYRPRTSSTLIRTRDIKEWLRDKEAIQRSITRLRQELPSVFFDKDPFASVDYYALGWGKMMMLNEVAEDNPFHTTHVFWLDPLALSEDLYLDRSLTWPDIYKLLVIGDRFLLPSLQHPTPRQRLEVLRSVRPRFSAYFLGGIRDQVKKVCLEFERCTQELLTQGWVQDENHVLELMWSAQSDEYHVWYPTRERFGNLPLPQRDLMIPYEWAAGTFMNVPYPLRTEVVVIVISSRTSPIAKNLTESCAHFGYPLVRYPSDEVAKDYLQRSYADYVILLRHDELFFVGCAQECVDKLQKYGDDLIVPPRHIRSGDIRLPGNGDIRVVTGRRETIIAYLTQDHDLSVTIDTESVYVATYGDHTLLTHPQRRLRNRVSQQEPFLLNFTESIPRGLWEGHMAMLHNGNYTVDQPNRVYTYALFLVMGLVVGLVLLLLAL